MDNQIHTPTTHSLTWNTLESFSRFGDHSASETPGSIPNPAVKRRSADGTAS